MKMKYLMFSFLFAFSACSEVNDFLPEEVQSEPVTRTPGDGIYDALGYGYDITEDYLGENATKLRVLNVEAFVKDNPGRFDNPFVGTIDQRVTAGEDAQSFLRQIIRDSNFGGSVASMGKDGDGEKKGGLFSATVKVGSKSDSKYYYSSKYSFARAEVLKKQRKYLLNTNIATLSKYLSPTFVQDLNNYSADNIVKMYGTHILTNITVGGTYTAHYKSAIIEEDNRVEKTKTVSAGAKFNLSKIGLDANGSWSTTDITQTNKKNSNWECLIKCRGGSTSGTSITLAPNQGPTTTINLGAWTSSVDDQHSVLVDVDWNATYPIYDLVSDPIKKAELKVAVEKYINSKKVDVLKLIPLYEMYEEWGKDRYYVTSWDAVQHEINQYGNVYKRHVGYILSEPTESAVPLYEMYEEWGKDRYYVTSWDAVQHEINQYGNEYRRQLGYILLKGNDEAQPFYEMYEKWGTDRYYVTSWDAVQHEINQYGNVYKRHVGYIY